MPCRKAKTRCELLNSAARLGSLRCHRCSVLGLSCSYVASNIVQLIPNDIASPRPPVVFRHVPDARSFNLTELRITVPAAVARVSSLVPEDLLPTDIPSAWRHINRLDWRESPMLAVQEACHVTQSIPVRATVEEFYTGTDHRPQDILGPRKSFSSVMCV